MKHNERLSVLIADSLPVARWGVRHLLKSNGFAVAGEADTIADAITQVRSLRPDIIITGLVFPDGSGIDMIRQLSGEDIIFLAFSLSKNWGTIEAFINAGGSGFVSKNSPPEELLDAISAILNGHQWISPKLRETAATEPFEGTVSLSKRENEIAELVARGLTTRQIADQLCLSEKTVETHRYRIFKKLRIQNRAQLVDYALENGLIKIVHSTRPTRPAE